MEDAVKQEEGRNRCESRNLEIGRRGEAAAAALLERRGIEIIERNWRCKAGEADIVALDEGCLVFVEVKTRVGIEAGMPEEAITAHKRDTYERIAAWYLAEHDFSDMCVRFDVITVLVISEDRALIRHVINAFGVGE